MDMTLPPTVVIRVSRGELRPGARFPQVSRMTDETARYLIRAIPKLPGLLRQFSARSPAGSYVCVSIWEAETRAHPMATLKGMTVDAAGAVRGTVHSDRQPCHYPDDLSRWLPRLRLSIDTRTRLRAMGLS